MVGPSAARDKLDILAERVGLRPCRPEVRLEKELFHGGTKLVVHNYGHGTIKGSKALDGLGRADSDSDVGSGVSIRWRRLVAVLGLCRGGPLPGQGPSCAPAAVPLVSVR